MAGGSVTNVLTVVETINVTREVVAQGGTGNVPVYHTVVERIEVPVTVSVERQNEIFVTREVEIVRDFTVGGHGAARTVTEQVAFPVTVQRDNEVFITKEIVNENVITHHAGAEAVTVYETQFQQVAGQVVTAYVSGWSITWVTV